MRVSTLLIAFGLSSPASAALFSEKKSLDEVAIAHIRSLQRATKFQSRKLDDMPDFSDEAMCVLGTMNAAYTVGTTEDILAEINDEVCNQSTLTCDFSSYFANVDQECTSQGGMTITGSYTICEELFLMEEGGGESPGGDITISGVAMCVSPESCPDDMTIEGFYKGTVEFLQVFVEAMSDGEMDEATEESLKMMELMTGECNASAGRGIGSLVLASVVGIGALFAII